MPSSLVSRNRQASVKPVNLADLVFRMRGGRMVEDRAQLSAGLIEVWELE